MVTELTTQEYTFESIEIYKVTYKIYVNQEVLSLRAA